MKLNRIFIALLLVGSMAVGANAQVARQHGHRAPLASSNPQALTALQTDLTSAIQAMTAALPIYDGNRVRSIHAAHRALIIVDRAISGVNAAARPKPTVRDNVHSKHAHGKYTAQQIAQSQANMQTGLAALNTASKDLQSAIGATPNKAGVKASQDVQLAIAEATKAISLHAGASPAQP